MLIARARAHSIIRIHIVIIYVCVCLCLRLPSGENRTGWNCDNNTNNAMTQQQWMPGE